MSVDGGETWTRRKVKMGDDLEGSGLRAGELFIWQGEKYIVKNADGDLKIQKIKKAGVQKRRQKAEK